jgi:hypothetical protein
VGGKVRTIISGIFYCVKRIQINDQKVTTHDKITFTKFGKPSIENGERGGAVG